MSTFLKIVFIVVVAAVVIGVGVAVFNAGIAQGMVLSGQLPAPDGAAAPVAPYYAPYYPPWGFGHLRSGSWIFGLCGFLLLGVFIIALGRLAFGPRHGWRHGPWGVGGPRGFNGDQVPPFVEEAHRKMHEKMNQPPTAQA